ncbi:MAG: DUF4433 domain-containing protein, partial [Chloroflexi bacterium]|nr:DUF4433 domain-containing protein [Chloroflexota bacterium]
MERRDIPELHYIVHIDNVPSIMTHGILSHRRAQRLEHISVANPSVQEIRDRKRVPGGRWLHDYVNLYLCARNPMLYVLVRTMGHDELCVLRVSAELLDLPTTIMTDGNAAKNYTR